VEILDPAPPPPGTARPCVDAAPLAPAAAPAYIPPMPRPQIFEPCIPTRGAKVPAGPDWLHEIKHDGYRLMVRRDGDRVRLFTRRGL
jgi:ATP-dependent DNA ligase